MKNIRNLVFTNRVLQLIHVHLFKTILFTHMQPVWHVRVACCISCTKNIGNKALASSAHDSLRRAGCRYSSGTRDTLGAEVTCLGKHLLVATANKRSEGRLRRESEKEGSQLFANRYKKGSSRFIEKAKQLLITCNRIRSKGRKRNKKNQVLLIGTTGWAAFWVGALVPTYWWNPFPNPVIDMAHGLLKPCCHSHCFDLDCTTENSITSQRKITIFLWMKSASMLLF